MLYKISKYLNSTTFLQHSATNRRHFRTMALLQSKKIIAVCQMTAKSDKKNNIGTCSALIKAAKELNAEMVFLPESCDFIGESKKQFVENAEDLNGETMQSFCEMARENKVWLSLGGILEKVDDKKIRNAHVVIDSGGAVVSVYRKIHLFDVDIPEKKIRIMESDYVLPGSEIVSPVQTPVGHVGLAICYDMRFPELSLTLTKMGADILTYPSAFTFATGAEHWETLLRARAIENQCYVVAAAQTGSHNSKRSSWGHAMVLDPWGTVVAQCSEGTNIAIAQIDLSYVQQVRETMPVWQHRRNDLYAEMSPLKTVEKPGPVDEKAEFTFGSAKVHGSSVFYKTSRTLAFTNIRCVVPGHVLVMPMRCVQTLNELENDEMEDLLLVLTRVRDVVEKHHSASGTTSAIQTGSAAGQTIKHLHVHVLPVMSGEKIVKVDADDNRPLRSLSEMAAEASMLRSYFC